MSVDAAVAALTSVDTDNKVRVLTGDHCHPDRPVLEVETEQRQAAFDAASSNSDVVLQLDTDEIVLQPEIFHRHVREMFERGDTGLEYPLRDFHAALGDGRFLERCHRFWRTQAAYPGPVAVRSGAQLVHCRQCEGALYRVDVRQHNTDPWHARSAPVHATVRPGEAIAHMSWVRSEDQMAEKSRTSGYAGDHDWDRDLGRWRQRTAHPFTAVMQTPFHRDPQRRFRISRLPLLGRGGGLP